VLKLFRRFIVPTLSLLIPIGASAGRKVYTYPMKVSTDWITSGSACYLLGTTTLSLKNISNKTQSLSVKVTSASVMFGTCGGVALGGRYTLTNPGCYNTDASFPSIYAQSITMAPFAAADVDLTAYCNVTLAGIDCWQTSHPLQLTAPVTSAGLQYSYRLEVQVDVTEDQGALIGSIYSKPGTGCAGGSSTAFNFPLNGGRPF
jgi:hypothetical protein